MQKIGRWVDKRLKWFFTVPTIIFVLAMVLFPIIYTLVLSFHSWRMSANIPWEYVGLQNYIDLFSDSRFPMAIGRTFIFTAIALTIEMILGIGIALFLNRRFFGKNFVKTAFLIPMVATPVAIGMVWKLMYDPNIGILDYILKSMGMPTVNFLGDSNIALYSLIVVDIWEWTPQVMLIVLAGITSISTEPFRVRNGGRRYSLAGNLAYYSASPPPHYFYSFLIKINRCSEDLRYHVLHDSGRPWLRDRNHEYFVLPASL